MKIAPRGYAVFLKAGQAKQVYGEMVPNWRKESKAHGKTRNGLLVQLVPMTRR